MRAPQFSVNDYVGALQALFPRGFAWPRDPDATLTATLHGLASAYYRTNAAAIDLLEVSFPATVDDLLPEWNESLGLPGVFGYTGTDLPTQQAQVVAALTDSGGQSAAYFIALAAGLGLTITINGFRATRVNDPVTWPLYGPSWAHVWRVTASVEGDYSVLMAIFPKYAPAHTVILWDVPGARLSTEDGATLITESGDAIVLEY